MTLCGLVPLAMILRAKKISLSVPHASSFIAEGTKPCALTIFSFSGSTLARNSSNARILDPPGPMRCMPQEERAA